MWTTGKDQGTFLDYGKLPGIIGLRQASRHFHLPSFKEKFLFPTQSQRRQPRFKFLHFVSRKIKSSHVGIVFLCSTVVCNLEQNEN